MNRLWRLRCYTNAEAIIHKVLDAQLSGEKFALEEARHPKEERKGLRPTGTTKGLEDHLGQINPFILLGGGLVVLVSLGFMASRGTPSPKSPKKRAPLVTKNAVASKARLHLRKNLKLRENNSYLFRDDTYLQ